jgi:hypothetical protein
MPMFLIFRREVTSPPSMKSITLLLIGLSGLTFAAETSLPGYLPKGLASSDWSGIRAAYEAGRHAAVRQQDGTLAARNPGQQWCTEFDGKGFTVTPDHRGWTWGLELTGYGERKHLPAGELATGDKIDCPPPDNVGSERETIASQRDENLTEWFINDACGLEQGWTFLQRPERADPSAPLNLHLFIRGNLSPRVSADGASVNFQQESGGNALIYGGLKAWDADGMKLPVYFELDGGKVLRIAVADQSARYPVTVDPVAQQAYLKAANSGASDLFGSSVAISGNTVVVGAPQEGSNATGVNGNQANNSAEISGAAYVFVRSGTTWTQQAYLKASNTNAYDLFGDSVAIDGDTVVVGAFQESSNATGVNGNDADNSATDSGAAYVFVRNGTTWSQQAYLKASNSEGSDYPAVIDGDRFGWSVSVSGNVVVVGARYEDSSAKGVNGDPFNNAATDSGAAYVFARNGTTWTQQAYLKASNAEGSPASVGGLISTGDNFGYSVAASGETVVVGAFQEGSNEAGVTGSGTNNLAPESGAAYVFVRSGSVWTQQAYL